MQLSNDQAKLLSERIKEDELWRNSFYDIVEALAPALTNTPLENLLEAIHLPWWNKGLVFRQSSEEPDQYQPDEPSLIVPARLSHSYITQLKRAKKLPPTTEDSASISNVLLTADGLLVLGYRAGRSYPHTLMTIPAGSVDYHSGKSPIFETFYAEHLEEDNLVPEFMESVEFIGRVFDCKQSKNSLYVSRTKTELSFAKLLKLWNTSSDRREHTFLVAFNNDPNLILEAVQEQGYDHEKADQKKPSNTTMENVGRILPPAIASLLLHCTQQDQDFRRQAEEALGERYVFREKCF